MFLPHYSVFSFAIKKTTMPHTRWYSCKEDAGRELGRRTPKGYVTITVWSGYKNIHSGYSYPEIGSKATHLESYLNNVSKEFGSKDRFVVSPVKDTPGCLHIRVPPDWCDNRVSAHLFFTYVRKYLKDFSADEAHLSGSSKLLDYGRKAGMTSFNEKLRGLIWNAKHSYYGMRGIVDAQNRFITNATNQ